VANRPLDPVYPVVFLDALRVKIRDEGLVKNKAVCVRLSASPPVRRRLQAVSTASSSGHWNHDASPT
jgi:putative transposase